MKINRLETHDRLEYLKEEQSQNVFQGAEDCLRKNPLSIAIQERCPYVYIFAHARTLDDGNKAMYWQPRVSRPKAETNSYLFRAKSRSHEIEVCWIIPPDELWQEFSEDKMMEDDIIRWSINQYRYNRQGLEKPDPDDISEERGKFILRQILNEHKQTIKTKPKTLETSLILP